MTNTLPKSFDQSRYIIKHCPDPKMVEQASINWNKVHICKRHDSTNHKSTRKSQIGVQTKVRTSTKDTTYHLGWIKGESRWFVSPTGRQLMSQFTLDLCPCSNPDLALGKCNSNDMRTFKLCTYFIRNYVQTFKVFKGLKEIIFTVDRFWQYIRIDIYLQTT